VSFHDVRFPEEIGNGSALGVSFRTLITSLDSGREQRQSLWGEPRYRYDVAYGIRSMEALAGVMRFARARDGALNSFRFKDSLDYHTSPTNPTHTGQTGNQDMPMSPAVGDGSTTVFRLVKTYVSGSQTRTKTITLPVSGTIEVWINDILKTEGVDYTINYTTGAVTFATAPAGGAVPEWSGEFDRRVRFGDQSDKLLQGVISGYDIGNIAAIELIEVLDDEPANTNEFFYGGAIEQTFGASFELSSAVAYLYVLSASAVSLYVALPDPTSIPAGGPHFCIVNEGSNAFDIKDESLATLYTLPINKSAIAILAQGASAKSWYLLGA